MAGPFGVSVLTPSAAPQRIETAVFDALRMTAGKHEAVCEGVNELVRNRKAKTKS